MESKKHISNLEPIKFPGTTLKSELADQYEIELAELRLKLIEIQDQLRPQWQTRKLLFRSEVGVFRKKYGPGNVH